MNFRKTHERGRYDFRDVQCIAADCWAPGAYQHRGAALSGSRNTGSPDTLCCMNRAYHGCPREVVYDPELAKARRGEGWKRT